MALKLQTKTSTSKTSTPNAPLQDWCEEGDLCVILDPEGEIKYEIYGPLAGRIARFCESNGLSFERFAERAMRSFMDANSSPAAP
jgi:hypothetical protein